MRFLKLFASDFFHPEETMKFFDLRTYRVEFDGEIVGFMSRSDTEIGKGLVAYIAGGTSLGLLSSSLSSNNEYLLLTHKDENAAVISIRRENEETKGGARLLITDWVTL